MEKAKRGSRLIKKLLWILLTKVKEQFLSDFVDFEIFFDLTASEIPGKGFRRERPLCAIENREYRTKNTEKSVGKIMVEIPLLNY